MADGATTVLGLIQPSVGSSNNTWGSKLNEDLASLDTLFDPATGHAHTGVGTNGTPLTPLALAGVVTTNVGFPAIVSDTTVTPRAMAALANGGLVVTNGDGVAGAPTFSVDPTNATAETTVADNDYFLFYDTSATALRKATRASILTAALTSGLSYQSTALGNITTTQALASGGGSAAFTATLTGNCTLSITGAPSGALSMIVLYLTNGGAHTLTHPTTTRYPGGTAPTLTTAGVDKLVYSSVDGATWDLSVQLDLR